MQSIYFPICKWSWGYIKGHTKDKQTKQKTQTTVISDNMHQTFRTKTEGHFRDKGHSFDVPQLKYSTSQQVKVNSWWRRLLRRVRSLLEILHNGTIIPTLINSPCSQRIIMEQKAVRLWYMRGCYYAELSNISFHLHLQHHSLSRLTGFNFEPITPKVVMPKPKPRRKLPTDPAEYHFSNFLVTVAQLWMVE